MARAVIAAAIVYGDDPVRALSFDGKAGGPIRKSITAAASGLVQVTGLQPERICGPLRVSLNTLRLARGARKGRFVDAEKAAMRAVEFAGWRPEAAASVVAAVAGDRPDGPPGVQIDGRTADGEVLPPILTAPCPAQDRDPGPGPVAAIVAHESRADQDRGPVAVTARDARIAVEDAELKVKAARLAKLRAARPPEAPAPAKPQVRPGRIMGGMEARVSPTFASPPPTHGLAARILALLSDGSANTQGMATCLDAKESAVCSELRVLLQEGRVTADPVPKEGLRAQRWRLAA